MLKCIKVFRQGKSIIFFSDPVFQNAVVKLYKISTLESLLVVLFTFMLKESSWKKQLKRQRTFKSKVEQSIQATSMWLALGFDKIKKAK